MGSSLWGFVPYAHNATYLLWNIDKYIGTEIYPSSEHDLL